jgi:hypothetical protein
MSGATSHECPNGHPFPGMFGVRCPECDARIACQPAAAGMRLVDALRELHAAGLELAPLVGPINARISVRWDEAMGAAHDTLEGQ